MINFRDLLNKGEGKVYLVNRNAVSSVSEVDCVIMPMTEYKQRRLSYAYWYSDGGYVICRKSKAKGNEVNRDGQPIIVSMTRSTYIIRFYNEDLDKTYFCYENYYAFTTKDAACNFAIEKIKKRKLELNAHLLKLNKLKFSVTE